MPTRFMLELRNKTHFWIEDDQASIVDKAWEAKARVKVNGAMISTVDITGLWPENIWYDNHPEERPKGPYVALPDFGRLEEIRNSEPTPKTREWYEIIKHNKGIMAKGRTVKEMMCICTEQYCPIRLAK